LPKPASSRTDKPPAAAACTTWLPPRSSRSSGWLPLTGAVPAGKELFGPFLGLLGAIYVVGGVLDHRELTRILRPPAGDGDQTDAQHVGGDVRAV
jgi:hypothetical protein